MRWRGMAAILARPSSRVASRRFASLAKASTEHERDLRHISWTVSTGAFRSRRGSLGSLLAPKRALMVRVAEARRHAVMGRQAHAGGE